jgi:hypothetical protein
MLAYAVRTLTTPSSVLADGVAARGIQPFLYFLVLPIDFTDFEKSVNPISTSK